MKFLQAEFASVRYHLAEIRDDWNDPRDHLREARKSLDAIEVGLQRLPREFAERVHERYAFKTRAAIGKLSPPYEDTENVIMDGAIRYSEAVNEIAAELEGEGVKA